MTDAPSPAINRAVAAANDLPQLVQGLQQVDPALAQQLTGKALLASKSAWGNIAVPLVVYSASRFGLNWDHDTCALVAGAALLVSSFALRAITRAPITSLIRKKIGAS